MSKLKAKILTVLGNRPQFIKAAVVSRAIISWNTYHPEQQTQEVIVHTGQHYDFNMSDIFFKEMRIPAPDYHLGIYGGTHGAMTGKMIEKIEEVISKETPKVVLVYGDTNSTLAGALAAVKLHVPIAHVEAGLRSFNMRMPEEINRILTDRISTLLFCPTETAIKNLSDEGIVNNLKISPKAPVVLNVGDVMYDAALFYERISKASEAITQLIKDLDGGFYLATVHRAENTDDYSRLTKIVDAFNIISKNIPIVFPLHPRTRKKIAEYGINLNGVRVIEPIGYFDMLALLKNCKAVFTDSGGLQKEAYFFHKHCIILRDETEWTELVEYGFNKLVGANRDNILIAERSIETLANDFSKALYGTGDAGKKIIRTLAETLF